MLQVLVYKIPPMLSWNAQSLLGQHRETNQNAEYGKYVRRTRQTCPSLISYRRETQF